MAHQLFPSVEAMLAPESLPVFEGQPVTAVRTYPFHSVDSKSGNRFLAVETNSGRGHRFILKQIRTEWDWIMRATDDHRGREVRAWETGLLDRLPGKITHGVIACAEDGPGWAILMHDFGEMMVPPGDDPIDATDNERFLGAMAALHASFWEQPEEADPALGFCTLHHRYTVLSPKTGRRELHGPTPIPRLILEGWDLMPTLLDAGIVKILRQLLEDPRPLTNTLGRYPQTIVHGDWKLGNLGLSRGDGERVVLLDWAVVGPAPPGVDLAWYLAVNSARLPVSKEVAIATYKGGLEGYLGARFDERWWQPQLDLSLLGGFLQLGWAKALGAARDENPEVRARERAELAWWSDKVTAGASWLR